MHRTLRLQCFLQLVLEYGRIVRVVRVPFKLDRSAFAGFYQSSATQSALSTGRSVKVGVTKSDFFRLIDVRNGLFCGGSINVFSLGGGDIVKNDVFFPMLFKNLGAGFDFFLSDKFV